MGWKHRALRALALGLGLAAISVVALLPSAAAKSGAPSRGAIQAADLSTVPAIKKYLRSVGIETKGLVVQRGPRNYAGPNCPGPAWNCTQSTKVIQVSALRADEDDDNRYVCRRTRGSGTQTPSSPCVIVQGAGATNSATCDISTTSSGALISQTCLITQGGNSNTATAKLRATLRGNAAAQDVRQRIEILQTGGSAGNNLAASQSARIRNGSGGGDDDDSRRSGSATDVSSKQDFHQVVCTNQQATGGGANSARVTQDGRATATFRSVGDVLVEQNTADVPSACTGPAAPFVDITSSGHNSTLCPIESGDSGTAKANANTCARVQQVSGTGTNSIVQRQSSRLDADVDRAGEVEISQGSLSGGIDSTQDQKSDGVSINDDRQDADQDVSVKKADSFDLNQIEDPRCCAGGHQLGNNGNTWLLVQDLLQRARVDGQLVDPEDVEGGSVTQRGANYGSCTTSGTCTVQQQLTNNVQTETNSCTGASCDVFVDCTAQGGEGGSGFCTTEDDVEVSNTASASSETFDPNLENNSDTEGTLVVGGQGPTVVRSVGQATQALTPTTVASDLAFAISHGASFVTGASITTPASDTLATAVADSDTPLGGFPTGGNTYAILTSGDADLADDGNVSEGSGADLGGGAVRGDTDRDVTILQIDLFVPEGRNCLTFDFKFLSEEYLEYLNSQYNDAFIAELDNSTWDTNGSVITAPDNFAFDPTGNVISVNAAGNTSMTAAAATDTTYDGATPLLSASTPIDAGEHSLYLSIFDQGDNALDSAVFVDALVLGTTTQGGCQTGATVLSASKTADEAISEPGGTNGYTITISNPSDTALGLASIFDVLPPGFSYVPGSTTGATTEDPEVAENTLTWEDFEVPANGSISLSFDVTVATGPGTYFNEAGGAALEGGNSVAPTGPTAPIAVEEGTATSADLSVSIADSPDPVEAGEELAYTITVANTGPDTAEAVTLLDDLPESFAFGEADPSQGECTQVLAVSCALGDIVAGGSATVTITVTP